MGTFVPGIHAIQNGIALMNHPNWGRGNGIEIAIGDDDCNLQNTITVWL
jgi:hypothetical protein